MHSHECGTVENGRAESNSYYLSLFVSISADFLVLFFSELILIYLCKKSLREFGVGREGGFEESQEGAGRLGARELEYLYPSCLNGN